MARKEKKECVWKDRKRFLGLPLSFTKYSIQDQRLFYSKGFFRTTEDELLFYRILDIKLNRTLGDKLVGVGTITLYTADKTNPTLDLIRIRKPKMVRDIISKMVEDERMRLNLRGKELFGVAQNELQNFDVDGDGDLDVGINNQ